MIRRHLFITNIILASGALVALSACSAGSGANSKASSVVQAGVPFSSGTATDSGAQAEHSERTPDDVMNDLIHGNQRFSQGRPTHPAQSSARRAELASGQHPEAIILSCSDSRVPPEIVFDRGLGELFVVRTAGEVADDVAVASIEYSVEHLGSKLIVVLGHESCGAVKAALNTPLGKSAGSSSLDQLVGMIRPDVGELQGQEDPTVIRSVKSHAVAVARSLSAKSHIIRHAVEQGHVKIVSGVYDLDTGRVQFLL